MRSGWHRSWWSCAEPPAGLQRLPAIELSKKMNIFGFELFSSKITMLVEQMGTVWA